MLKAIQRKMVRLAMALAVIWLLIGPPVTAAPSTVLPAFASECCSAGGNGC
jgi:hypothetical protein